jgi:hypothetical protein
LLLARRGTHARDQLGFGLLGGARIVHGRPYIAT